MFCLFNGIFCYNHSLCLNLMLIVHVFKKQLETVKSRNKGYQAEVKVVTFCRRRQESDDKSKFRILLVSSPGILYYILRFRRATIDQNLHKGQVAMCGVQVFLLLNFNVCGALNRAEVMI